MKTAVIIYHSNIHNIYKKRWIQKCIDSILNQTYADFDLYEIDYGNTNTSIIENTNKNKKYWSENKKNYAHAMNFLLDQTYKDGYNAVFNTNLDDFYEITRFEKQIELIKSGCDLVSSDFCYVKENKNNEDEVILHKKICSYGSIENNLKNNHNVIAHPCVCYSRNFISNERYNDNLTPFEDMNLWKSTVEKYKFHIINEELLYYRIHEKQSSNTN